MIVCTSNIIVCDLQLAAFMAWRIDQYARLLQMYFAVRTDFMLFLLLILCLCFSYCRVWFIGRVVLVTTKVFWFIVFAFAETLLSPHAEYFFQLYIDCSLRFEHTRTGPKNPFRLSTVTIVLLVILTRGVHHRILHEHRNGHGANTTWHRSD